MTTAAVLTPEEESVSSGREQQASTRASQDAGNPFLDVRRAWNGVWEESLSNARRWRLMALFEAGLLALALFGLIHLGQSAKSHSLRRRGEQTGRSGLLRAAGAGSSRQQCH